MRLYLVQHGLALPESEDPKRGLTDKGIVCLEYKDKWRISWKISPELYL